MQLPLFPLHTVAFPGSPIPVHVFEMRYRAMMERVLAGDRRVGIVAIRAGMEVGGHADVHDVGCLAEVERVQRAADGTMAVVFRGTARFRIAERLPDDPFPVAEVESLREDLGERFIESLAAARAAVNRYLRVVAKLQGQEVVAPQIGNDPTAASFALAGTLQVDMPERQRLLEASDAAARLRLVAEIARAEATLLAVVGPSVGRPRDAASPN